MRPSKKWSSPHPFPATLGEYYKLCSHQSRLNISPCESGHFLKEEKLLQSKKEKKKQRCSRVIVNSASA